MALRLGSTRQQAVGALAIIGFVEAAFGALMPMQMSVPKSHCMDANDEATRSSKEIFQLGIDF